MQDERPTPRVVVIGAGAAGSLTALHLARVARRRGSALDVVLVDSALHRSRGTAFGTTDPQHLLNVAAGGMSALPEDPGHFVAWRARQHPELMTEPGVFAPRVDWGRYLDETLSHTYAHDEQVSLRQLRVRATGIRRDGSGVVVTADDGRVVVGDAVVLATGEKPPGVGWAPESLQRSPFFVPDPWAPGAIDVVRRDAVGPAEVLLVGTGLTMVDVVLSLTGPSQRPTGASTPSRATGELPKRHADQLQLAAIPEIDDWGRHLEEYRRHVNEHIARVQRSTGDWRPAVDGLRTVVQALWQRLDEGDRTEFLRTDASAWGRVRHRMPPGSADVVAALEGAGDADAGGRRGRRCRATDRRRTRRHLDATAPGARSAGWSTAPAPAPSSAPGIDPLVDDLLTPRGGVSLGRLSTAGLGFRTSGGGWWTPSTPPRRRSGPSARVRRGELLESTAIPEIRTQAAQVAAAVLDEIAPLPRRLADGRLVGGHHPIARPRDPLGLPLSTTAEAAAAYNAGLERLMRLQSGADEKLLEAVTLDPGLRRRPRRAGDARPRGGGGRRRRRVARGGAALRPRARRRARAQPGRRGEPTRRDVRNSGATALMNHIAQHPRDVLAVSAAVPTIAFSGVTDIQQEAWELVEGLAPAYGDHWWYISLLAFTRQDQSRFDDAGLLAESALVVRAHVRSRRPRADARDVRDRAARGRPGLARPLGRGERPRGQPPGALLLARRAARAGDRRHRGGAPALLHPARAADRHRRPRTDRRRLAAVAMGA